MPDEQQQQPSGNMTVAELIRLLQAHPRPDDEVWTSDHGMAMPADFEPDILPGKVWVW